MKIKKFKNITIKLYKFTQNEIQINIIFIDYFFYKYILFIYLFNFLLD